MYLKLINGNQNIKRTTTYSAVIVLLIDGEEIEHTGGHPFYEERKGAYGEGVAGRRDGWIFRIK